MSEFWKSLCSLVTSSGRPLSEKMSYKEQSTNLNNSIYDSDMSRSLLVKEISLNHMNGLKIKTPQTNKLVKNTGG